MLRGYVKFLEVIAYPDDEVPTYTVPSDGFIAYVDEVVKKGSYVGTVEFTEIVEIIFY